MNPVTLSDEETAEATKRVKELGERTYRVASRMLANFEEVIFFVSPRAHDLWHLQLWLFPEHAGKKVEAIPLKEVPKGFRYLDQAVYKRFMRDLARFAVSFSGATHEELLAAKIEDAKKGKRKLTLEDIGVKK